jgi:hypothetical protein
MQGRNDKTTNYRRTALIRVPKWQLLVMPLVLFARVGHSDPKAEIIGRWQCRDASRRLVVFRKDGTCSVGWDGKGNKSSYKVDRSGEVVVTTHGPSGFLAIEHFTLHEGKLAGIRGGFGNPRVVFKKKSP